MQRRPSRRAKTCSRGRVRTYDLVPRDPAQLDLELLVQVASALQLGDHVPPYPQA
jgi:hypothetical protein